MNKYYCENCGALVAQIKNGSKLRKGVVFLCEKCYEVMMQGNMFKDIFGGKK